MMRTLSRGFSLAHHQRIRLLAAFLAFLVGTGVTYRTLVLWARLLSFASLIVFVHHVMASHPPVSSLPVVGFVFLVVVALRNGLEVGVTA